MALATDFKKHGAAAIEKVRKQQPAAYMKICALLVPREMFSPLGMESASARAQAGQRIDNQREATGSLPGRL